MLFFEGMVRKEYRIVGDCLHTSDASIAAYELDHAYFRIYSLVPYVDGRGVLRVKGRLEQAELFHNEEHPAILL
ncbi:hypothetical protein CEXT_442221 [Caerostris extrusa]|uniref:Uncharacterized protein n=1 Tax=Caerostris extrusa TaxID=172846 RepID=A0AAV4N6W8_CAEEX|nr:hypothetical protein CEXT_442221 [Caerostris extrusa]